MCRKLLLFGMVIFVLLGSSLVVSADAAASMWSQTYGGAGDDWACSVVATPDGGYAIAGTTDSFGGSSDFWLLKTDAFGNVEWNRTYGGEGNDVACSLVATSDGGYALAGTWNDSVYYGMAYYGDFWLVKTDALGNMQWNKTYGGAGLDKACSLVTTSDGGYALAGTRNYLGTWEYNYFTGGDFWLVKTDAVGNVEWDRTYGGAGNDVASSLVTTSDGGYAVAGTWNYTTYYGLSYYGEFWLVKTDAAGNMQWNGTYGETGENKGEYASSLVATPDGGYTIAGTLNFLGGFWLVKTDASGNMQWNQTYANQYFSSASSSLVAISDGGYIIAGYAVSSDFNGEGYWLAKTDTLGNIQWNQTHTETGGPDVDGAWSLIVTSDGGYALAGRFIRPIGAGGADFWLVKTDENGVVPEYSSWLVPALVLTATAFVIINRKRLLHKYS